MNICNYMSYFISLSLLYIWLEYLKASLIPIFTCTIYYYCCHHNIQGMISKYGDCLNFETFITVKHIAKSNGINVFRARGGFVREVRCVQSKEEYLIVISGNVFYYNNLKILISYCIF